MNSILRLSSSFLAALLLLAPSSAHAVRKCPTMQEILDQYVRAESPRGIKEWAQRMVKLMKSRAKWDGYLNFSEKEFSSENVQFLVAVRTYQEDFSGLKPSERLDLANAIYDKFIGSGELNLGVTLEPMHEWKATKPQSALKDTFDKAYLDIMLLFSYTYSRFRLEIQKNGLGNDKTYKGCK